MAIVNWIINVILNFLYFSIFIFLAVAFPVAVTIGAIGGLIVLGLVVRESSRDFSGEMWGGKRLK